MDHRQYGVLAVSPEGLVCYWPSMTYDSSPIEIETELVGQEFHSLVEFQVEILDNSMHAYTKPHSGGHISVGAAVFLYKPMALKIHIKGLYPLRVLFSIYNLQ